MAGRGPAPKDPSRRARRNADPVPLRAIEARPCPQPDLPETFPMLVKKGFDTVRVELDWPERTLAWWRMWRDSPLSDDFTETDWSELLDTARLHAEYWSGRTTVASELRLRVAKFGATPEDRARLRIQFATADEADEKRDRKVPSSRERRGPLRAV